MISNRNISVNVLGPPLPLSLIIPTVNIIIVIVLSFCPTLNLPEAQVMFISFSSGLSSFLISTLNQLMNTLIHWALKIQPQGRSGTSFA